MIACKISCMVDLRRERLEHVGSGTSGARSGGLDGILVRPPPHRSVQGLGLVVVLWGCFCDRSVR